MTQIKIPDMNCGHCKASVERAIASAAPNADFTVDLPNRTVEIDESASLESVLTALKTEGYPATVAG
jgi:copper chaperone